MSCEKTLIYRFRRAYNQHHGIVTGVLFQFSLSLVEVSIVSGPVVELNRRARLPVTFLDRLYVDNRTHDGALSNT